jgi:hypothetical protein
MAKLRGALASALAAVVHTTAPAARADAPPTEEEALPWKPPPVVWVSPARKAPGVKRFGYRSLENTVRTDERYGHDGLSQGPRAWNYWNEVEHPKPIQNPNLWPDSKSTYFFSQFSTPAGSTLALHCKYPYARYHKFALYTAQGNTYVPINEALAAQEIEPDPGSETFCRTKRFMPWGTNSINTTHGSQRPSSRPGKHEASARFQGTGQ